MSDAEHALNPSYEPTAEPRNARNEAVFAQLQKLCQRGLVEPVGAVHMYDAAMHQKACRLTRRGRYCWHLAKKERI